MSVELIDITPPSYLRYPLPAHEVPHEYHECGDPEWCWHEPITDSADLQVELTVPEQPTQAVICMDPLSREVFRDRGLQIHTGQIRDELRRSGFSELDAKTYAIRFYHQPYEDTDTGMHVGGFYNSKSLGHVQQLPDGNIALHPLTININTALEQDINRVLWHEFGHYYSDKVLHNEHFKEGHEEFFDYHDEKKIERVRRLANRAMYGGFGTILSAVPEALINTPATPVFMAATGIVGFTVAASSAIAARFPQQTTWMLNPEERFAEKFARKRQHLQPIKPKTA